ncbi:glutamate mutase L [Candidatus Izimaplasma bacterium]|nr:glutamate mutase L [Candidatus Izimaplasma bacterium]
MLIDVLVAEIGSTTTIVNAFEIHTDNPKFLGRGVANTTVDTDVTKGLQLAIEDLSSNLNVDEISYKEMFAASSAAGGLKVSVHGLVYEMTVRASREAALNAGANIHLVTAGKIKDRDLDKIQEISPNIIIIAGGTDYGESETAIYNAERILALKLDIPIIYAGNIEIQEDIQKVFIQHGKVDLLKIVDNVYPRVDLLNILPLRQIIYETFEENIIHAKGMEHIKEMVDQKIMPTPGSVMESTMILRENMGNIITIDVGGATTDVHSVANPSEDFSVFQEGEPLSKRTVEGDLGVFINHKNVLKMFDKGTLSSDIGVTLEVLDDILEQYAYIPTTKVERSLVYEFTKKCTNIALDRHVGDLRRVFTSSGQKIIPEGKDLTQVENIILTGGALVNLDDTEKIVLEYIKKNQTKLLPTKQLNIYVDNDYILAAVGVLSLKYPSVSLALLKKSMRVW